MKKLVSIALALCLMLCAVSCSKEKNPNDDKNGKPNGGQTTEKPNGGQATDEVYKFTYNGVEIAMHADAKPVIDALGEPKSYTEEASCAFEGLDKTYYYGNIYIDTYPDGDTDRIKDVWFATDGVTTPEGIYIGSAQDQVEAAYGAAAFNGKNAYELKKGASKFTVILTDGVVSSIQYDATFDD